MNSSDPAQTAGTGDNRGGSLIGAAVATVAISATFVGLRFYTRGVLIKTLGWADWVILISLWVKLNVSLGLDTATLRYKSHPLTDSPFLPEVTLGGVGRPAASLDGDDIKRWLEAGYYTTLAYIASLLATKLSVLLLYLRILSSAYLHRTCYIAIGVTGLLGAWSFASNVAVCVPPAAWWDRDSHPNAWCWPLSKAWSDVGIHVLTELIALALPLPYVSLLSMPLRQKIGVGCLFALGIFVCGVTVGRIPALEQAVNPRSTVDRSYNAVALGIWSCIEINTAIVCACLMTLRPLASRIAPRLVRSGYRRYNDDEARGDRLRENIPLTVGSRRIRRKPRDALDEALDSTASTTLTADGGHPLDVSKVATSSTSLAAASIGESTMTRDTSEGAAIQPPREWPP